MNAFGYVLGVILTDGSVFIEPGGQHRLSLQCRDEAFAARFADAIGDITGARPKTQAFSRMFGKSTLAGVPDGYVFHGFTVRASRKDLCLELMRYKMAEGTTFLPMLLSLLSADTLIACLTAIVDADGYIAKQGEIVITQKDPTFIIHICTKLGIPHRVYSYEHQTADKIVIRKTIAAAIDTYKRAIPLPK